MLFILLTYMDSFFTATYLLEVHITIAHELTSDETDWLWIERLRVSSDFLLSFFLSFSPHQWLT